MKRRILGILAAFVLAAVGTYALVSYVQSAKDEAVADERQVPVYVLTQTVPKSTPASQVKNTVELVDVPVKLLAAGAVTELSTLDDRLVAAVDLQEGEQLLESRFIDSRDLTRAQVPTGLQELTVSLDPERAVGGAIAPGYTVGVVISFDPFNVDETTLTDGETGVEAPEKTPNMTHLTFHKVLVTGVQFAQNENAASSGSDDEDEDTVARAPENQLLVTLALSASQVEQVVFAAEFGRIWLTAEGSAADETGTRIVTLGDVYGPEVQP